MESNLKKGYDRRDKRKYRDRHSNEHNDRRTPLKEKPKERTEHSASDIEGAATTVERPAEPTLQPLDAHRDDVPSEMEPQEVKIIAEDKEEEVKDTHEETGSIAAQEQTLSEDKNEDKEPKRRHRDMKETHEETESIATQEQTLSEDKSEDKEPKKRHRNKEEDEYKELSSSRRSTTNERFACCCSDVFP